MSEFAIDIDDLRKSYPGKGKEPEIHALRGLQLQISRGEVFGLLGPNGAGKTTLVKMLLGAVHPTSGRGRLLGHPAGSIESRRLLGYLPENHRYPPYLTAAGVMDYFGRLSGLPRERRQDRSRELLELVGLTPWRTTRVKKFSKGMMQRLGLAQALINDPELVLLDEPTDGVDPVGRKEIRDIIVRLRSEGRTVFLNSHLLSEVELVCDRVAILDHGTLLRLGTVAELTAGGATQTIELAPGDHDRLPEIASTHGATLTEQGHLLFDGDIVGLNRLIDALRSEGVQISGITRPKRTLEEIFINTIGAAGGDA